MILIRCAAETCTHTQTHTCFYHSHRHTISLCACPPGASINHHHRNQAESPPNTRTSSSCTPHTMNPRSIRGQHAASTTQSPPPASPLSSARPAMATTLLVLMLMAAVQLVATARVTHGCQISEFACRGGALCLPLDKYCDGRDDCGDASDEPKFCTGEYILYSV